MPQILDTSAISAFATNYANMLQYAHEERKAEEAKDDAMWGNIAGVVTSVAVGFVTGSPTIGAAAGSVVGSAVADGNADYQTLNTMTAAGGEAGKAASDLYGGSQENQDVTAPGYIQKSKTAAETAAKPTGTGAQLYTYPGGVMEELQNSSMAAKGTFAGYEARKKANEQWSAAASTGALTPSANPPALPGAERVAVQQGNKDVIEQVNRSTAFAQNTVKNDLSHFIPATQASQSSVAGSSYLKGVTPEAKSLLDLSSPIPDFDSVVKPTGWMGL